MSQPNIRPAPNRVLPWPLALLIFINLFNYLDRQVLAAVEYPISQEFDVSKAAMGWLVFGFLIVYMIFAPLFGWWADRFSKWKLIGFSMILQSLASGGSGMAESYFMLLIMRCSVGIGEAAWGPAAPSLLADMYPASKRGKIMALFYTAIPVGSALGYAVGGVMRDLTGDWRAAFYVLCPPGILLGLLCFLIKDPVKAANAPLAPPPSIKAYTSLLKIPSFTINCIGMTLMTFAIGGVAFWMPRYLEVDRGLTPNQATIWFGVVTASAGLIGTLAGGFIGDKLRGRFAGSYFHVSGAGMMLGFPLFLLLLITPFPFAWVILFLAVMCLFLNTGPGNTILANVVPAHVRATGFALNIFIIHLFGDAFSPPLIGIISDHAKTETSSGLATGFLVVSIVIAIGGAIWWTGAKFLERDTQAANAASANGGAITPHVVAP